MFIEGVSWPLALTTYLEAPSLTMLASVTSNSRLSVVGLLLAGEGLASPAPRRLVQLS